MGKKLNDLDGKAWVQLTKSWKIYRPGPRNTSQIQHPAKFPEELCADFVNFFTHPGEVAMDPFMGTGTATRIATQLGRLSVGIELDPWWYNQASANWKICGDCTMLLEELSRYDPFTNLILTSPPDWDMLGKSRGNSKSQASARTDEDLSVNYREDSPLTQLPYGDFLTALSRALLCAARTLYVGGHMVVVLGNFLDKQMGYLPLAWDVANELMGYQELEFLGEKIWLQDDKQLGIWGYPSRFISNVHHHYCLIFRRR